MPDLFHDFPVVDGAVLDGALQRQVTTVGHCQITEGLCFGSAPEWLV